MGTLAASSQAKAQFPLSWGWRLVVTIAKCLGTTGRGQVQGKKLTDDGALSREGRDPGPYPGATSPGHWRSQYIRHVLPIQAPTAEGWHQGQEPGARPRFHALSERLGEFSPTNSPTAWSLTCHWQEPSSRATAQIRCTPKQGPSHHSTLKCFPPSLGRLDARAD